MPFDHPSDVVVSLEDTEVHFTERSGIGPFASEQPVHAVDGGTLDSHENDVIALVGESGCGKTTLGKAAIAAQEPTGGSVAYRGQDIWDAASGTGDVDIPFSKIRRALQIIPQDPGSSLNPNRTVMKSLDLPLKNFDSSLSTEDRRARILGMLEHVGMTPATDYAHRYPHQLSGGEKQRVALVRAVLLEPDLILADEAISALDVSLRVEMMDLMLDLQDQFDTAFLFVSHDLSNARYICEKAGGRIGVMYLGELVEIGTADQIINDPRHPYTKALRWATPKLRQTQSSDEMPIRSIDIPDPVDPPSGCRYHTRCPEAREVCTRQTPGRIDVEGNEEQMAKCFRELDDHEYWESEPLVDEDDAEVEASR